MSPRNGAQGGACFTWVVVFGRGGFAPGMLAKMQAAPSAVLARTGRASAPHIDMNGEGLVLRAHRPPTQTQGPLEKLLGALRGTDLPLHHTDPQAHGDARAFLQSELQEREDWYAHAIDQDLLPWAQPDQTIIHLWLRSGLAWCAQPKDWAHAHLADQWPTPLVPALIDKIGPQRAAGPFGIALLDVPDASSAHQNLTALAKAQEDIHLVMAWLNTFAPQPHDLHILTM